MAKLHIHPVGLILMFLGFLSWIVALGGLAASTSYCNVNKLDYSCATTYQVEWWSIIFEFLLLFCMVATVFINAFERARFIYLAYLSIASVLLTISARNFINTTFTTGDINVQNFKQDSYNAAAAGCIMLGVVNYSLIIFIGLGAAEFANIGQPTSGSSSNFQPEQKYSPSNF